MTTAQTTPLVALLSLLTTSIHTIEAELKAAHMPSFTLEPKWHPLDSPDAVPTPRLHEARKVAMASANMICALVQDVGTALMDMSSRPLDTSAYILTADVGLIDVYRTDEERTDGLHIDELVARLPEGKKVEPGKLARCLHLLSVEHWWTETALDVFAPTRWALLNARGSPTWAWHDPASSASLVACTEFTEHLTDPSTLNADTIDSSPAATVISKASGGRFKNFWEWVNDDPERVDRFALSMEGIGYVNIASIKADYPWDLIAPNTTFVDVGSGQGSAALHILKHLYTKQPTFKVVLQDLEEHIKSGKKYWAQELPEAIADGRVEFEPHDFFIENPRKAPNTIYWFRFIMHDWHDNYAIRILKQIRASCHESSRVLIADCMILPATPTKKPGHLGENPSFEETLRSINNESPYEPIEAPYPIPSNFGFATKANSQLDILMMNLLNALERTRPQFEEIISAAGFKIHRIYRTRGAATIIEAVPV